MPVASLPESASERTVNNIIWKPVAVNKRKLTGRPEIVAACPRKTDLSCCRCKETMDHYSTMTSGWPPTLEGFRFAGVVSLVFQLVPFDFAGTVLN